MHIFDQIRDTGGHDINLFSVCNALGLDVYETRTHTIFETLMERVEREVAMYYEKCPFDRKFNPIHIGQLTDLGKVQAIGNDIICAGELIYSDGLGGYPIYSALECKVSPDTLEELLDVMHCEYMDGTASWKDIARRYKEQLKAVLANAG